MFANKTSVVAGIDGSFFSDFSVFEVEAAKTTFSLNKLGRDIAALTRFPNRNASAKALIGAYIASEA